MENTNKIKEEVKNSMNEAISHLKKTFSSMKAGKASTSLLDSVKVDCYGTMTSISQIANVSLLDRMGLNIQPYDKGMLPKIEKAITYSNIGVSPMNSGESIQIRLPALTQESRKDLVKKAKEDMEDTKVRIRKARGEAIKKLKNIEGIAQDTVKSEESLIQKITDQFNKEAEEIFLLKEKEILTV